MADKNFKFCTACGRKVALNAQFCVGCGPALGARDKSGQAPAQKASAAAPVKKETAPTQQGLTAKGWFDKGTALCYLGRYQEAIQCHDKALAIDQGVVRIYPSRDGQDGNKSGFGTIIIDHIRDCFFISNRLVFPS